MKMYFKSVRDLGRLRTVINGRTVNVQSGNKSYYRYYITSGNGEDVVGEWITSWKTAQAQGKKVAENLPLT